MGFGRLLLAAFVAMLFAPPPSTSTPALGAGNKVLSAITYKNLTLMPVAAEPTPQRGNAQAAKPTRKKPRTDYEVLDDAMRRGKVTISEESESGNVNSLTIRNDSDKPLFILGGEVIIGGKQDRVIANDAIISPKTTETIAVFCVEHGRWSGRKASFESAGALAHTELRKQAKYKASQSDVWREVKSKNQKRKTSNGTDTYRGIAKGKGTKGTVAAYERHFRPKLASLSSQHEIVGFVVAMNGELVAIEIFGSEDLFGKLQDKVLRSYFVEAIDHPVTVKAKTAPSNADITKFSNKSKKAKAKKKRVGKSSGSSTYHFEDDELDGALLKPDHEAPVYQSVHRK